MQNRRNRSYASYSHTPARKNAAQGLTFSYTTKAWLCAFVVLFSGIYIATRGHAEPDQKVAADAKVTTTEAKVVKETQSTPFPTLNVQGFTSLQLKMLAAMKTEYAKHPVSFDKTVLEYTEGTRESWCADFLSVIRFESGKPFINEETGYWRIPGVQSLRDYYAKSQAYHPVGTYIPKFGDVAFYFGETPDGQNREHVAFVLEVRGDTLVTLGGNETDKGILQIRFNGFADGERGLTGFGESHL